MTNIDEIEARRVELQVSQQELCREAKIDPSTYTKLRQNPQRTPSMRTVRKLRLALDRFAQGEAA